VVGLGFLELAEELASVGRERLDVAALPLGEEGVEGEAGFTGAGHAGDNDETVAGNIEVDLAEIVDARAAHTDVGGGGRRGSRPGATGFCGSFGHSRLYLESRSEPIGANVAKRRDDPRTTAYFGGKTVKTDPLMEVLGSLDELGSALALARSLSADAGAGEALLGLQHRLLELGAGIANPESRHSVGVGEAELAELIAAKETLAAALPPLQNFIVPGADPGAAAIHLCRSICRRAERAAQRLHEIHPVKTAELEFVNQLSNYLFELARRQAELAGVDEEIWFPRSPEGES